MEQGQINPNVVLTADTGQYDAALSQSASVTDSVAQSIDSMTKKISQITKVAGASLTGVAILDTVAIGKATAAWSDYEKQVSRLEAQAKSMSRSEAAASRSRETYLKSVKELRKEFGTTTAEAAKLTLTLSKMSDSTSPIQRTAKIFEKMSIATGEGADGLATSVLNLQKVMGTPQRDTSRYADQLNTLAASANTSAQGLADFAAQIAPIGRAAGMTQTEVTGVAKAFIAAGQDGYRAATGFNKIMSDISYATSTGSPDLAKYANLIGVTVEQFKNMGGAEKAVAIFDNLNRMGPRAIVELNRMGLDGVNMVKSITAMSQQTGGLGSAIQQSKAAYGDGSTEKASAAAMKGISDEMGKLREELSMTAEEFGSAFGPAMIAATKALDTFVSGVNAVMSSPLGDLIKLVTGAVAPIAGFAGGVLLLAGALVKLSGAAMVWRNSGMLGMREGLKGSGPITPGALGPDGKPMYFVGGGGQRGNQIAANGTMFQRGFYNFMNAGGRGLAGFGGGGGNSVRAVPDPMRSGFVFRGANPYAMTAEDRAGMTRMQRISRAAGTVPAVMAMGLRHIGQPAVDHLRFTDPTKRSSFLGRGLSPVLNDDNVRSAADAARRADNRVSSLRRAGAGGLDMTSAMARSMAAHNALNAAIKAATTAHTQQTAAVRTTTAGFNGLRAGAGMLAKEFIKTVAVFGIAGAKLAGQAAFTGLRGASRMLGGPLGLAMLGIPLGMMAYDKWLKPKDESEFTDRSGAANPYLEAAGVAPRATMTQQFYKVAADPTKSSARTASMADMVYAKSAEYKPIQTMLKDLKSVEEVVASLAPQWREMKKSPEAINKVKQDLLHYNFNRGEVSEIFGQLDAIRTGRRRSRPGDLDLMSAMTAMGEEDPGRAPGMEVFLKGMGTYGDGANEKLAKAMGVRQDNFSAIGWSQGTGAAGEYALKSMNEIVRSFGAQGELSSQAIDTFAQEFAERALGGISLEDQDVRDILLKKEYSDRDSVKGKVFSGYGKADFIAEAEANGLDTRMENAEFSASLISKIVDVKGTGAGYDALGAMGIADPTAIEITDKDAIKDALLDLFKQQREEDRADRDDLGSRIEALGGSARIFGEAMGKGGVIDRFLNDIESPSKQFRAIDELSNTMGVYTNPIKAIRTLANIRQEAGSDEEIPAQVAKALQDRAQAAVQLRSSFMQPQDAYRLNVRSNMAVLQADNGDVTAPMKQEARENIIATVVQRAQEIRQQLLQNKQFEVSMQRQTEDFQRQVAWSEDDFALQRRRAFEDFHQQRMWAEQDYQISRRRGEQDYNIARDRSQYQFHLGMKRNRQEFNIARHRQEKDHHHQVMLMIEEQAKSMYNMYDRVRVQQTNSATWLLVNSRDQTERMTEQTQNLNRLRKMGVNDNVIQQMGLTDSANAQQLSRFVAEVASNPELVRKFNQEVAKRLKAAKNLVTDESSTQWQEFNRQYRLARDRGMKDFQRAARQARQDFRLQMSQMEEDHRRGLRRMADDYERGQDRMQKNFSKSMNRSATDYGTQMERMRIMFRQSMRRAQQDMDIMAKGVQGTIRDVMVKGAKELRGELGKQARESLNTFDALGEKFGIQGWRIMKQLADIFGFKAPKKPKVDGKGDVPDNIFGGQGAEEHTPGGRYAAGGVVPGWSPGVDTQKYKGPAGNVHLSGGEAIMRPEFTRAIGGEKAVHELNRAAIQGRLSGGHSAACASGCHHFWKGGVFPVKGAAVTNFHGNNYSSAVDPFWAGDINRGSGNDDLGAPVRAWRKGTVAKVIDMGDRSYGRYIVINHPNNLGSLYAHLSDADVKAGDKVGAGDIIGNVGHYGTPSTAHLHLELFGSNVAIGGSSGYGGGGGGRRIRISEVIKDQYPGLEKQAAKLMNGAIPEGRVSKFLNAYARDAWKKMVKKHGLPRAGGALNGLGGHYTGGGNVSKNINLAKRMANDVGWDGDQWRALRALWMAESGFDHQADNPNSSAYGIPQAIVGSYGRYKPLKKMGYFDRVVQGSLSDPAGMKFAGGDPEAQIRWGLKYIKDTYGTPKNAWSQWSTGSGYRDGALFQGLHNINVGEHGPEMVLPLNNHGAQFMADTLKKYSVGTAAQAHGLRNYMPMHNCRGGGESTTNIDRSTNFTGPITVQANNPGELVSQLQARQRVMALTNPVMGGKRL